jgi:hypothetical protein
MVPEGKFSFFADFRIQNTGNYCAGDSVSPAFLNKLFQQNRLRRKNVRAFLAPRGSKTNALSLFATAPCSPTRMAGFAFQVSAAFGRPSAIFGE